MWQSVSGLLTKENLTSPSTAKAAALVAGLLGYTLDPTALDLIGQAVAAVIAAIEFGRKHAIVEKA
jgi:hypothetical protein